MPAAREELPRPSPGRPHAARAPRPPREPPHRRGRDRRSTVPGARLGRESGQGHRWRLGSRAVYAVVRWRSGPTVSGIAGVYHFDGREALSADIERMTKALAARGPDGPGTGDRGTVGLGHRPLWTTPEAL